MPLLFRFLADLIAWLLLPAAFLYVYVRTYTLSTDAIEPHFRVVVTLLLAFTLIRVAVKLAIRNTAVQQLATALVMAMMLAAMLMYYGLVMIGLATWGRVISWELVRTYAMQSTQLADVLGASIPLMGGMLLLGFLGLIVVAWLYSRALDWVPLFVHQASAALVTIFLCASSAIVAIELYSFLAAPPTRKGEPVSLTFFPLEGAWNLQGLAVDSVKAAGLDRAEDAARSSYHPKTDAGHRNVILIVADALRSDHMKLYGYDRETTPSLSQLAGAGSLRQAPLVHSTCASSACGLFSLGSSKFAHQFSERPFTLQEALKLHGYRIHMILGGDHTTFYNLRRIYGEVDSYFDGHMAENFAYMNDDRLVVEKLATISQWDGVPVMLQIHLMSTHLLGKRHDSAMKFLPSGNYALPENRVLNAEGRPEKAINYYDNGVLQADETIRALLDILTRKGYLSDAVVVVTGDHGESLGEHGLYQHTNSVREEVLKIPLVLISYGYKPLASIDAYPYASQVDISPTILAELGLPLPQTWVGKPLQKFAARDFTYFREQHEIGLFDHRDSRNFWKYWVDTRTAKEYAFNLTADSKENVNAIFNISPQLRRDWRLQILPATSVDSAPRWQPSESAKTSALPNTGSSVNSN